MTETFYKTGSYKVGHTTYGGELSLFDFEGKYTMKAMADKIIRDFAFDEQCRKNIEFRKRQKNDINKGENENEHIKGN